MKDFLRGISLLVGTVVWMFPFIIWLVKDQIPQENQYKVIPVQIGCLIVGGFLMWLSTYKRKQKQ